MSNGGQAQLHFGSRPQLDVVSLGKIAVVAVTTASMGLLLYAGWLPALAVAGIASLAVCAVTWPRAFRIAVYVGVVALPFVTAWPLLQPDEYNYPTYFAGFALAIVALGALQPRMFSSGAGTLYLLYISLAGLITVVRSGHEEHLPKLAYILAAFALYTLVRRADSSERRLLIGLVIALGVIQSILAVTQSVSGGPSFDVVLPELLQSRRNYFAYLLPGTGIVPLVTQGSGTLPHFNALGAVLALCLPLAFGLWVTNRRSPWLLLALLMIAAGLVATFSRGALLGALAGGLFVLWFGPARSRRTSIALALCLAVLLGLLGASVASQYFQTTQNLDIRVATWQTALGTALDRPSSLIAGYGYGHFHDEVLSAGIGGQDLTERSTYMASLHSGYLQLLLEFGIVAAVLFATWMVSVFRRVTNVVSPSVVPVFGGAVGLLCSQALDNALFSYAGVLFVALLAVVEAETVHRRPVVEPIPGETPRGGR